MEFLEEVGTQEGYDVGDFGDARLKKRFDSAPTHVWVSPRPVLWLPVTRRPQTGTRRFSFFSLDQSFDSFRH